MGAQLGIIYKHECERCHDINESSNSLTPLDGNNIRVCDYCYRLWEDEYKNDVCKIEITYKEKQLEVRKLQLNLDIMINKFMKGE